MGGLDSPTYPSDNVVKLPSSRNPSTALSRQVDKAADGPTLRERGNATGAAGTSAPATAAKTRTSSLSSLTRPPPTAEAPSRHDEATRQGSAPRAGTGKLAQMLQSARRGSATTSVDSVTTQPTGARGQDPVNEPETAAEKPRLSGASRIDSDASTASGTSTWSSIKGKVSPMNRFGRNSRIGSDTSVSSAGSQSTAASSTSSATTVSTQSSLSDWSSIKAKAGKPFHRPKPAGTLPANPGLGRASTASSTSSKLSTASSSNSATESAAKDSRAADRAFDTAVWGAGKMAKGAWRAAKRHLPEPMVFPEGEHPLMPGTLPEMQDEMQDMLKPEPPPVKSRNPLVRARKWVEEAPDRLREKADDATADFVFNQAYELTANTVSMVSRAAHQMLPSMKGPEFENGHHELMPGTLPEQDQAMQELLSRPTPTLVGTLQKSMKQAVQKTIVDPTQAAVDEKMALTWRVGLKGAALAAQGAAQALNRQLTASGAEGDEEDRRLMPGVLPEMKDEMKALLESRRAPTQSKTLAAPAALPEAGPAKEAPAPELPDRSADIPGAWID